MSQIKLNTIITYMYELYPYFTNDGSVGLFSPEADDIYHSTYGALTEAFEKFIIPSGIEKFLENNSEIKILDICFGIGYNTKSFLQTLLKKHYNETIYTNNNIYNEKIDTNNKLSKVFIHAIDTDKNLALLSPFIISNKKITKNNQLNFKQEKIKKMLSNKTVSKYKLFKEVDYILFEYIANSLDQEAEHLLFERKYSKYFNTNLKALYAFIKHKKVLNILLQIKGFFLHNIYYKYISNSYKRVLKLLKTNTIDFKLSVDDARNVIKNDKYKYNYIFLDAFTPTKCPCLWSLDFFKLLYEHLEDDGMILTYSNSALVRSAFINAGYWVGKIYSKTSGKYTGTVAVKSINPEHIKNNCPDIHDLSEYDLGLIKTKAGIFYRDENLTLSNEAIISRQKDEAKNSNLISSSKYIKLCKNNY